MDDAQGNKIIELKNPKIVNGGQTTKTLFNLSTTSNDFREKIIRNVFILCRIYETDDQNLINKITEGTNRQNPTYIRDLKANDPMQEQIKKYFKLYDVFLETKRNEYHAQKISPSKIVKNDRVFQAYLSLYESIPHQAKSGKSKVFDAYFPHVFKSDNAKLPFKFYRSYQILKFIESKESLVKIIDSNSYLLHCELALVFAMGLTMPNIKDDITLDLPTLENVYSKSIKAIESAIENERNVIKDSYSHNNFFKSSNSTTLIQDQF